ncbi:hypothetical protein BKA62DRAFT_700336 [Auriculariales sp. MPI-PUGE-AT-0066]|nr:hypothetical protein BKA62DRAFT_700336 [Auriculariales sp. MPI-PUGE-AT-0066]
MSFFLSVENSIDIESAAKRLAEQLGVGETSYPQSTAISALEALSCSLLVIDNLETLWFSNKAAAQKDTERFLKHLSDIPALTLIVTSRDSIPPSGVQWSNPQAAGLATLSLDQIADRSQLTAEREALDKLLDGVDCEPLAVTLLPQLAALGNAPFFNGGMTARLHSSALEVVTAVEREPVGAL